MHGGEALECEGFKVVQLLPELSSIHGRPPARLLELDVQIAVDAHLHRHIFRCGGVTE